ncbi:hypothetical protein [Halomonas sp. H5]|uniref:hypothetical protein n=1 Tax=Halomonas sp. H5 TaxID=3423910 RepID=UPI003D36D4B3
MKVSCKNEFHSLVSSLCSLLSEHGTLIKTSRAQELLSRAFGYKSANGLLADLPVNLRVTEKVVSRLGDLLKERHGINSIDTSWLLRALERGHMSYSTHYGCDKDCYPAKLPDHTNYWYLTQDGWVPWSQMNFTKMRVELNIYKVVSAFSVPFFGEDSYFCTGRPIWTADIARAEFESEAERLERKYGEMPENSRMYSEMSDAL